MYTSFDGLKARLGAFVINPHDSGIGAWKYGFSEAAEKDQPRLVTKSNPRSIYNGLGGVKSATVGGLTGAMMAVIILSIAWYKEGRQSSLLEKLKGNWYCIVGGMAMIAAWELVSDKLSLE